MVGGVEVLDSELQVVFFGEFEVLYGGEIPVDETGAINDVAAGVAVTEAGVGETVDERGRVKPTAGILLAAGENGTDTGGVGIAAAVAVLDGSGAATGGGGEAGDHGEDGADLPAAGDGVSDTGDGGSEAAAAAEGEFVEE